MPDFVTKVPFTSYQSALHCMLRKFPMVVTKVPFHVTKVPDLVTKVPFTSYQSAPCDESSLWSLQKCPKLLLKCRVLVTKVPFPLALSLSLFRLLPAYLLPLLLFPAFLINFKNLKMCFVDVQLTFTLRFSQQYYSARNV